MEKSLADFQAQAGRPFEHEARLKELLARQAELNAALDLDKGERQAAAPADGEADAGDKENSTEQEPVVSGDERRWRRKRWKAVEANEEEIETRSAPKPVGPGTGL